MKIVATDNFNREYVSDVLIAENVSETWAKTIVKLLNTHCGGLDAQEHFVAYPDDKPLYKFEP